VAVFDSGFGGLNILAALRDLLPHTDLIYFGDSARSPYGSRPAQEVQLFSLQIARYLVANFDPALLVVACNTASAVALDALKRAVPVPVVGVIDAGVRASREATISGRIGFIGTVRTVASGAYQRGLTGLDYVGCACPGLVEFVERGELESEELTILCERLLAPLKEAKIDTLLLACTHYPYLARTLSAVIGEQVTLISPAEETAFEVSRILASDQGNGEIRFLCTGDPETFVRVGQRLFGPSLRKATRVDLEQIGSEGK
jgi:glutamate racemase